MIYIRKRSTREKKNQMWSPCTMPGEELAEQYQAIDVTVPICIATLELAELQSCRRATYTRVPRSHGPWSTLDGRAAARAPREMTRTRGAERQTGFRRRVRKRGGEGPPLPLCAQALSRYRTTPWRSTHLWSRQYGAAEGREG